MTVNESTYKIRQLCSGWHLVKRIHTEDPLNPDLVSNPRNKLNKLITKYATKIHFKMVKTSI